MSLIDKNESNIIAGPSNGSGIEARVENTQRLTEQQRGLNNDYPTTSAGANHWNMEVPSETEGMQAGTKETNFNNESVLTKTMNVLKDKAGEAYSTLNKLETVYVDRFAEKMRAVGLPITEEAHEYTELRPMGGPVVEKNSQGMNTVEGTVYTESKPEGFDWEKLRRDRENALNQISDLIGTKHLTAHMKTIHTSILCILTSLLLGVSFYSMTMGIRLISRHFKLSFSGSMHSMSLLIVTLVGILTALNCISVLVIAATDLWCRKTKPNMAASIGVLLYGMIAVVCGIIYPASLNPYKISVDLYWVAASLLATVAFTIYIVLFRKTINTGMQNWVKTSMFKPRIVRIICFATLMVAFVALAYFIQKTNTNNVTV
ncbi:hypothetical protein NEAUS06_1463 [Nematocida ausubeli]|nr:hypothetical protein NEAUS06_1463 [Nematocida ausubeli]